MSDSASNTIADNNDNYVPVSCEMHSELELFVMHRQRLRLRWHDSASNITQETILLPVDVCAQHGAEYLHAIGSDHKPLIIRLDRVHEYKKIPE